MAESQCITDSTGFTPIRCFAIKNNPKMKQLQFSAECDQYLSTGDQMIN